MNWEIVGATGEWFGSLAILITLIYLARQIKVASKQFARQVSNDMYTRTFEAYEPFYDGRNGEIMYKGLHHPGELEDVDYFVFDLLMHRQFGAIGEIARELKAGNLTAEAAQGFAHHYEAVLFSKPGCKKWMSENQVMVGDALEVFGAVTSGDQ